MYKWLGMNCGLEIAECDKAKEFTKRREKEEIQVNKKGRDSYGMNYMAHSQGFSGRLLENL